MSAGGFKVFMADLLTAAGTFKEQSGVLKAVMPAGGPACPDGGDAQINHAMQGTAELLGVLNSQLATVVGQHATRLQTAHTRYANTDSRLAQLAYEITNPGTV